MKLTESKIPPQAKEIEMAVLGAIMLEPDAFDTVSEILKKECFYSGIHKTIFSAMQNISFRNERIDSLMLDEELRNMGKLEEVGGAYYITTLTNRVVNSANLKKHCSTILKKFIQRELIRIGSEILCSGYEDSADTVSLLEQAEEKISKIGVEHLYGDMVDMSTALVKTVEKIEEWRRLDTPITGVPSGYRELDIATRGWQPGDLIIIAARPSVGKTAFALNLVRNAALGERKTPVAVWSLEMKYVHLILRMLAAESKIMLYKLQTGRLTDEEFREVYHRGIQRLSKANIFFDDRAGISISGLRAKARRLKKKHGLGLIVVDYLQLMKGHGGNREQEIASLSRELKELAQELDIPVIALSQLSREVEKRTGMRAKPQLSDLRESGAIEQDADLVYFLWAPSEEEVAQNADLTYRRYGRIAKQRNGVLITNEFDLKDEIQLFELIDQQTGNWRPVEESRKPYKEG